MRFSFHSYFPSISVLKPIKYKNITHSLKQEYVGATWYRSMFFAKYECPWPPSRIYLFEEFRERWCWGSGHETSFTVDLTEWQDYQLCISNGQVLGPVTKIFHLFFEVIYQLHLSKLGTWQKQNWLRNFYHAQLWVFFKDKGKFSQEYRKP